MCLSSARNEDKSGGWIREKKTPEKYLGFGIQLIRQRGTFLHFQQKTDIYSYALAQIYTHIQYKEEWAR